LCLSRTRQRDGYGRALAEFGLELTYFLEFCASWRDVSFWGGEVGLGGGALLPQNAVRQICRIDGEGGFMVSYACSPELNSVATEVRTGAMKAVG